MVSTEDKFTVSAEADPQADHGEPSSDARVEEERSLLTGYDAVIALLLGCLSMMVYHHYAVRFDEFAGFGSYNNVLFGADQLDARKGWIDNHKGIHPLVLLIVVPLSRFFAGIAGSDLGGLRLFGPVVGATCVSLFFIVCRLRTGSRIHCLLVSVFFGLTMSQLIFGSMADTYVLAAVSNLPVWALMLVCLRDRRVRTGWWIGLSCLSFAVTLTMFANAAVCCAITHLQLLPFRQAGRRTAAILCSVIVVCTVLSVLQRKAYPEANLFFSQSEYSHEMQYTTNSQPLGPIQILRELGRNFLFHSYLGTQPRPHRFIPGVRVELVYFDVPLSTHWLSVASGLLWVALLIAGTISGLRNRASRPVSVALFIALLGNVALHSFYNTREIFLCSPHFTFLIVLLASTITPAGESLSRRGWVMLVLCAGFLNISTVNESLARYGSEFKSLESQEQAVVPADAIWQFKRGKSAPEEGWKQPGFDASGWETGRCGIGYGDGDDTTVLTDMRGQYTSVFVRREFHLPGLKQVERCWLDINFDDGFVLDINGRKLASWNMPDIVRYDSTATKDHEAIRSYRYFIPLDMLKVDANVIAIIVLNRDRDSSDLSLEVEVKAHVLK